MVQSLPAGFFAGVAAMPEPEADAPDRRARLPGRDRPNQLCGVCQNSWASRRMSVLYVLGGTIPYI